MPKPSPKAKVEVKAPTVVNVEDTKTSVNNPNLLHFTKEQWKSLTKGVKKVKVEGRPPKGPRLTAVLMPGGKGEILAAVDGCGPLCGSHWEPQSWPGTDPDLPTHGSQGGWKQVCDHCEGVYKCHLTIVRDKERAAPDGGPRVPGYRVICVDDSGNFCPHNVPVFVLHENSPLPPYVIWCQYQPRSNP